MGRQRVPATQASLDALATFGEMVRQARLSLHMTQAEVAARAGVSTPTVASIERGSASTSIGTVLNVAGVVGLPVFASQEPSDLSQLRRNTWVHAALLPSRIGTPRRQVSDEELDF